MIFKLWRAVRRRIDLKVLWPVCRDEAIKHGFDLDKAHQAFYFHAVNDTAWTKDFDDDALRQYIVRLR